MRPPHDMLPPRDLEDMTVDEVAAEAVRAALNEKIAGIAAELQQRQDESTRLQAHIRELHRRYSLLEAVAEMPLRTLAAIVRDVISAATEEVRDGE